MYLRTNELRSRHFVCCLSEFAHVLAVLNCSQMKAMWIVGDKNVFFTRGRHPASFTFWHHIQAEDGVRNLEVLVALFRSAKEGYQPRPDYVNYLYAFARAPDDELSVLFLLP